MSCEELERRRVERERRKRGGGGAKEAVATGVARSGRNEKEEAGKPGSDFLPLFCVSCGRIIVLRKQGSGEG